MVLDATPNRFAYRAVNSRGQTVDSGEVAAPASAATRLLERFARAS